MKYIFTLITLLVGLSVFAQMPTQISTIVEDAAIKDIAIVDINLDDQKDIVIMTESDDIYIHVANDQDYDRMLYFEVENPTWLGAGDLNADGGTDVFFSSDSYKGLKFVYGETNSPYSLPSSADIADEFTKSIIGGVSLNHTSSSIRVLGLLDDTDSLTLFETGAGSFFYLYWYELTKFALGETGQFDKDPSFVREEAAYIYFTDKTAGSVQRIRVIDSLGTKVSEPQMVLDGIDGPHGVAVTTNDRSDLVIYYTEAATNSVFKYVDDGTNAETFLEDDQLTNPTNLYLTDVDNDGEQELLVVDGNVLYAYTDLGNRSERVSLFEGQNNIADVQFDFINSDTILDVLIIEEGNNQLSILSVSEVLDVVEETPQFKVSPNPTADHLTIDTEQPFSKGSIHSLDGRIIFSFDQKRIDVSHLQPGAYILSLLIDGKITTQRIIIN